jgi:hypothetical protein
VIKLAPNEKKTGLVLTMLPPRNFRRVRVRIQWPNGSVPLQGAVEAWANEGIYDSIYRLKNGIVELRLLEGVGYWITASALRPRLFRDGTRAYAENYWLPPGDGPADVTLTAHFAEPQWTAIFDRR